MLIDQDVVTPVSVSCKHLNYSLPLKVSLVWWPLSSGDTSMRRCCRTHSASLRDQHKARTIYWRRDRACPNRWMDPSAGTKAVQPALYLLVRLSDRIHSYLISRYQGFLGLPLASSWIRPVSTLRGNQTHNPLLSRVLDGEPHRDKDVDQ